MKYTCETCGKEHESWPAIGFDAPYHYYCLNDEEKDAIAELSSDFCTIRYEDQTDHFIRAVLFQKVNGHCEHLHYGVWVSLSEKSFQDYKDNFQNDSHEATYFGYLGSWLPGYNDTTSIKTNVELLPGGNRPEVIPHNDQEEHPFVADYYNGVPLKEAEKRIKLALGT
ncbi:DUF2199 domain-containing protein [Flavisolibacter sp. BT320]|nr:DUF2199 domain-containing protein [Flavisolibacter longurius]